MAFNTYTLIDVPTSMITSFETDAQFFAEQILKADLSAEYAHIEDEDLHQACYDANDHFYNAMEIAVDTITQAKSVTLNREAFLVKVHMGAANVMVGFGLRELLNWAKVNQYYLRDTPGVVENIEEAYNSYRQLQSPIENA